MKKLIKKFPIRMNLQTFADGDDDDDLDLDLDDDSKGIIEGDPIDDENKSKHEPGPTPSPLSLNTDAWKNVVDLMSTQNAKLDEHLGAIGPALARMDDLSSQMNSTLGKFNESVAQLLETITPPVADTPLETPPITPPEPELKRSGLAWKRH